MKIKYAEEFRNQINIEIYKFQLRNIRDDIEKRIFELAEKKPQDQIFVQLKKIWGVEKISATLEALANFDKND